MKQHLDHICVHIDVQGEAWGGFTAEREETATYEPDKWPGLKNVLRRAGRDWGDVQHGSVRPVCMQIHYCLKMGDWTRWIVKLFDETDLERVAPY